MGNPSSYGFINTFTESVSAVTATNSVSLGQRRHENGSDWVYVYNGSSNEQLTTGRGCKLASGSTGYTVDVACAAPSTVSASILAGVCVNVTLTTGTYGWIMTRGFCQVDNFGTTSIATGDHLQLWTSGTFHVTTANTGGIQWASICGYATGTQVTTTTGSFTAYIKSPRF